MAAAAAAAAPEAATGERSAVREAMVISAEEARFVREDLYPWDAALHNLVCGTGEAKVL